MFGNTCIICPIIDMLLGVFKPHTTLYNMTTCVFRLFRKCSQIPLVGPICSPFVSLSSVQHYVLKVRRQYVFIIPVN